MVVAPGKNGASRWLLPTLCWKSSRLSIVLRRGLASPPPDNHHGYGCECLGSPVKQTKSCCTYYLHVVFRLRQTTQVIANVHDGQLWRDLTRTRKHIVRQFQQHPVIGESSTNYIRRPDRDSTHYRQRSLYLNALQRRSAVQDDFRENDN